MDPRRSRTAQRFSSSFEPLDRRVVLSGTGLGAALASIQPGGPEIAWHPAKAVATKMTLEVAAGTLSQPVTLIANVSAGAKGGTPTGTVNFLEKGQVIGSSPVTAEAVPDVAVVGHGRIGGSAAAGASITLAADPGTESPYFGKHPVTAVFVPSGSFAPSRATKAFTVAQPHYNAIGSGVKVATITPGTGPAVAAGQTANVLYSGYLASTGKLFDDSSNDGGSPLAFTVGAGQVVAGFDAGTLGMQVGETRIISIPPAEGYGNTANGPIPAHSTLIFVVTLKSIS